MLRKIAPIIFLSLAIFGTWSYESIRSGSVSNAGTTIDSDLAAAYQKFKDDNAGKDFQVLHLAAHEMGQEIFKKAGPAGAVICDSSFGFGCYHGFFSAAVGSEGDAVISKLDQACVEKFGLFGTGCQHGIGHGALEYAGHTKLIEALEKCKHTTQPNPLFGCTSGVFMEYNIPLVITDDSVSVSPRFLDEAHPTAPCSDMGEERFRQSCYFELGQWWAKTMDYQKMGRFCGAVGNVQEREICFLGLGVYAASDSDFQVEGAKNKCALMPGQSEKLFCLAGATWSFFGQPEVKEKARDVCEHLPLGAKEACLQKANLICNYLESAIDRKECFEQNKI